MINLSKIFALFVILPVMTTSNLSAQEADDGTRLAPMYSHFYLTKNGKEYSVWAIRPILWLPKDWGDSDVPLNAFVRDPSVPYNSELKNLFGEINLPKEKLGEFWEKREEETHKLMTILRKQNKEEYRRQGYYDTAESAAKEEADFDKIYDGKSSFIAITEKDNPNNVYQQIAIVPDKGKGLPIDDTIVENGGRPLRSSRVTPRNFNEFDFNKEGPNEGSVAPKLFEADVDELRMKRTWVSGAKVEIKALLKSKNSPEDFSAVLFKEAIAHDLLKFSSIAIPPELHLEPVNNQFIAYYEWHPDRALFYPNPGNHPKHSTMGFHLKNSAGWLLEPQWSTTVRNTEVYLSADSDALKRLYEQGLGFDENFTRVVKKENGKKLFVLQASATNIEEIVWEKVQRRKSVNPQDEQTRAASKNIFGEDVGFIRLESYGEGHRRRLLKGLAPDYKKHLVAYEPSYMKAREQRDIEIAYHASTSNYKNEGHNRWKAQFKDTDILSRPMATKSCAENFSFLSTPGASSILDSPHEVFEFGFKMDIKY